MKNFALLLRSRTTDYKGQWQNGVGTLEEPLGEHIFTSQKLIQHFYGETMADTFVWQRRYSPSITYHVVQW